MLKLFAVFSMIIDHVGLAFYPHLIFLRIFGRLAFPIFAYYLVQGYIHTSSLKKYALRLLFFGFASQGIYMLFVGAIKINILFELFLGLVALHSYKNKDYIVLIGVLWATLLIPIDYSLYGILTILGFYIFQEKRKTIFVQSLVNMAGVFLLGPIQAYSLVSTPLILYYPKSFPKIQLNKYFFYVFYPAHLALLYFLSRWLLFPR